MQVLEALKQYAKCIDDYVYVNYAAELEEVKEKINNSTAVKQFLLGVLLNVKD